MHQKRRGGDNQNDGFPDGAAKSLAGQYRQTYCDARLAEQAQAEVFPDSLGRPRNVRAEPTAADLAQGPSEHVDHRQDYDPGGDAGHFQSRTDEHKEQDVDRR